MMAMMMVLTMEETCWQCGACHRGDGCYMVVSMERGMCFRSIDDAVVTVEAVS